MEQIVIRNAHIHNLKHLDLTIPRGALVAITGVSGSGKSSLAFDLLFEEGRRRYSQAMGSPFHVSGDGGFDELSGLTPPVAVEQRVTRQSNVRSVVGTRSKLLTYLQALYSLVGTYTCPRCGAPAAGGRPCPVCGAPVERLPAGCFSFNSVQGMCLACSGRGYTMAFREEHVAPQRTLGDLVPSMTTFRDLRRTLPDFCKVYGVSQEARFGDLTPEARQAFLHGSERTAFAGLLTFLQYVGFQEGQGRQVAGRLGYGEQVPCAACGGYRVGEEARSVTIGGLHIGRLGHMTVTELQVWLAGSGLGLDGPLAVQLLRLVDAGLQNLVDVGLSHLTLYRSVPTLSGGELQRLFLMAHLDPQLDSLTYIFDEPTVGLHELEKGALIRKLQALKAHSGGVIVVEHDPAVLQAADHVIEMGPGAGVHGGSVIYEGPFDGLLAAERSVLGAYLSCRAALPSRRRANYRPVTAATPRLTIRGARTHNLQDVTVSIPLGVMVGVAGVSGSGKSSLIGATLVPLLQSLTGAGRPDDEEEPAEDEGPRTAALEGWETVRECAVMSQAPIGRSRKSTPATYLGIWDRIRSLFAAQPAAVERGLSAGHFSFNAGGACPECKGDGYQEIFITNMGMVEQTCPTCGGLRYAPEVLEVTFQGKTVAGVLAMSVTEAAAFFADEKALAYMLATLERVGLGYLTLGQPAPTLSGGEAQRIKLARELGRLREPGALYVLDEPTAGLGYPDTARLMLLLDELVAQGNTVVVVEHDPLLLSFCDWLIELGPGGGQQGGRLVAQGAPPCLARDPASRIGPFLKVEC